MSAAMLEQLLPGRLVDGDLSAYGHDATESRGMYAVPDAVVQPRSVDEVMSVVAWSDASRVPLIPRGGGTGFAGGAVAVRGGVVVDLSRMNQILQFDPHLWRIRVQAGVRTAHLRRVAREHGLLFPPDPGAAEDSQIGGNIATNAGGPHAYKYGVTGDYVTGLTAVVPPGRLIEVGGAIRKDVAGYDLKRILVGSEGTLGIVTDAWLRLVPAPALARPVAATFASSAAGCEAVLSIVGAGLRVAALEFLDAGALEASRAAFPVSISGSARFLLIVDADGETDAVGQLLNELGEILGGDALDVYAPESRREIAALWRWRDGISLAVESELGGKVSEDVVVPLDRLGEMIAGTVGIGIRHGLRACSWGHAGDGNLHSTFLVNPRDETMVARAELAADELFATAARMQGSISGEHGVGWIKRDRLHLQWPQASLDLHRAIKQAFDPHNLMNPGKKS